MRGSLIALGLLGGTAAAQAPHDVAPTAPAKPKSLRRAYAMSAAATAVPLAIASAVGPPAAGTTETAGLLLAWAGVMVGPSAGHWYAGETMTTGLQMRLVGGALTAVIVAADRNLQHTERTVPAAIVAVGLVNAGLVWDLVTLPRAIRRHDRESSVFVTPYATPTAGGLAVAGTF
jgi:hypothetical protein